MQTLVSNKKKGTFLAHHTMTLITSWPCPLHVCVLTDVFLPLSSLRLLIPPLRLLSAAMWQVAQQRDLLDYEKLDEFVSLVTATVPDLLSPTQRGKLLLRLRSRVSPEWVCAEIKRQGSIQFIYFLAEGAPLSSLHIRSYLSCAEMRKQPTFCVYSLTWSESDHQATKGWVWAVF